MNKRIILSNLSIILFSVLLTRNLYAKKDPYTQMAKELSEAADLLAKPKVAIIPFTYMDRRESSGGIIIAERLTTRIVKLRKLQVIERQLLEKVLEELHLELSGIVDIQTTKQLGKVLGVNAIITGTLLDIGRNKVEINARMIKTETAEIIATTFVKIKKTWSDVPVTKPLPVPQPPAAPQPVPQRPATPPPQPPTVQPVYRKPAAVSPIKPDIFLDFFFGFGGGQMDLSFKNSYYPIDEVDLSLDFDGDGNLESSVYYYSISFSGMETGETRPWAFRASISGGYVGGSLEMSFSSHYLKGQRTSVTLDGATSNFWFYRDGYIKVNTLILAGDVFLQYKSPRKEIIDVRPYIGFGLGITFNTVLSPYIYQYHSGVFRKPLNQMAPGFLFRIPMGARIVIEDTYSIFAEYRFSKNSFSFSRNRKNETDSISISMSQFLLGMGLKF